LTFQSFNGERTWWKLFQKCVVCTKFAIYIFLLICTYGDTSFLIKISSSIIKKRTLLSWPYGSWIYNYLCNQCLSPLTLWVRIPLRRGVLDTTLCDKVCQWLTTGQWFSEYNWNIVESGAKHHNPNPQLLSYILHKWEKLSLHLHFTKMTKLFPCKKFSNYVFYWNQWFFLKISQHTNGL